MFGTTQLMIYLTDVLAALLTGKRTNEIMLAFLPMRTHAYNSMQQNANIQLSMAFPFFFMCVYLLPLYYMVT